MRSKKTRIASAIQASMKLRGDSINVTVMRVSDGAILTFYLPLNFEDGNKPEVKEESQNVNED